MRIAWFSDTWLPARDGVVNSLLTFKKELERRGHEIFLFAPASKTKIDVNHGLFFYKSRSFRRYPAYSMPPIHSLLSTRTRRLIANIEPDILHAHSPGVIGLHGLATARRFNLPFLFTFHTFLQDSVYLVANSLMGQHFIRYLLLVYLRWFFRQCNGVIVPSQAAKIELTQLIQRPVWVVPTGVDIDRFTTGDSSKVRNKLEIGDSPMILHVGRVVKEKNLDDLLAAVPYVLNKIPDAVFVVVGTGPYCELLRHTVQLKELQGHVLFTGFVPDKDLPDYYAAADAFAFPSTYETQGIVALEAMAAGTPVVAARSRSLPELIEEGRNGYLFSPGNRSELAEKLVQVLGTTDMSAAALGTAEHYSSEQCADQLLRVYGEFI
jgi:1,2-diacylglycerol 3-alpha-glucosyltransferase